MDKEELIMTLQACYFGDKGAYNKILNGELPLTQKMLIGQLRENNLLMQEEMARTWKKLDDLQQIEQEHQKLNGELRKEIKQLKRKYDEVLKMLVEYSPPCEIDGFMDKNTDYCSMNCGVDEEVFKKCWDLYITQKIEKVEK